MRKNEIVPIHEEGKIDIHHRKIYFHVSLEKLKKSDDLHPENKELILNFIRDCSLGKTVIGKSKKKIGPARCLKYIGMLKQLSTMFGKSFNEISQKDMEEFIQNLENDKYKTRLGKPYSEATKVDIKKAIKKFWKWKDGRNKYYPELVEWIDTYVSVKEVSALKRPEIEKMIEYAGNLRDKALIMVLFDSGARIEELLNVRLKPEHIFWKEQVNCYMIRLEFSKTKPRTISLPLSTEYLRNWLEIHPVKDNEKAQLFPMTYSNLKMILRRIGDRVLNKRVTPHMLRHSSATFYANRLKNPYKLCYRYGWTMASKEVNRYLDREGILEEETPEVVKTEELSVMNKENQVLREELSLVKESHSTMDEKFRKLQDQLDSVMSGRGFMTILSTLIENQRKMEKKLNQLNGSKFDIVLAK